MENKLIKQFQVEELEQRLEMGVWKASASVEMKDSFDKNGPSHSTTTKMEISWSSKG